MAESDDLRQFIRDIANRHDRIWRDIRDEFRAERVVTRGMLAELQALRKENEVDHRAQLDALMHILDRLQNGGAQA
jgi:hypothetical protein